MLQNSHLYISEVFIVHLQPGHFQEITKYHSNQYMCCWKQWKTEKLVDVLCFLGDYEKLFWWFLDLNQFASNRPQMLDKKFGI